MQHINELIIDSIEENDSEFCYINSSESLSIKSLNLYHLKMPSSILKDYLSEQIKSFHILQNLDSMA